MTVEWSTGLVGQERNRLPLYKPGDKIAFSLKHKHSGPVSFEFVLRCFLKDSSEGRYDRIRKIFFRTGEVYLDEYHQDVTVSFFIPESFEHSVAPRTDDWNLSLQPTPQQKPTDDKQIASVVWKDAPLVTRPPPSFAWKTSTLFKGNTMGTVKYSIEIRPRTLDGNLVDNGPLCVDAASAFEEWTPGSKILDFRFQAGETLNYHHPIKQMEGAECHHTTEGQNNSSPTSLDSTVDCFLMSLPRKGNFPDSLEIAFPRRIIQDSEIQIPLIFRENPKASSRDRSTLTCTMEVKLTQFVVANFGEMPGTPSETKQVCEERQAFFCTVRFAADTVVQNTRPFTLSSRTFIPTFSVHSEPETVPGIVSKEMLKCYTELKIKLRVAADSWSKREAKWTFQGDLTILPAHYRTFMELGRFKPDSKPLVTGQKQQQSSSTARSTQQSSSSARSTEPGSSNSRENPPDYDTLSIRTVQTLPRYEDQ